MHNLLFRAGCSGLVGIPGGFLETLKAYGITKSNITMLDLLWICFFVVDGFGFCVHRFLYCRRVSRRA